MALRYAWTVRRWLHEMGWVWKRAKLVPKMTIRSASNAWHGFGGMLRSCKRMRGWSLRMNSISICLPKVGAAWMPKGSQEENHDAREK